uniref:Uncharacterized protein n=1 Tax=Glossina pallidipes TaxID=7398 RepID=A0A1B0AJX9_GLOPL
MAYVPIRLMINDLNESTPKYRQESLPFTSFQAYANYINIFSCDFQDTKLREQPMLTFKLCAMNSLKMMEMNETRQTWSLYELRTKNAKKLCRKSQMIGITMDDEGFLYHNPKRKKYSGFASSSTPKRGSWHRVLWAQLNVII